MDRTPRIVHVEPVGQAELFVRFENGVEKIYDCRLLFGRPRFNLLANPAFFRTVQVDPGGYGVSWSDEIDLSEYELWTRGIPAAKEPVRPERRAE
jgi:hypothetical protein